jgi:hypothetical protein
LRNTKFLNFSPLLGDNFGLPGSGFPDPLTQLNPDPIPDLKQTLSITHLQIDIRKELFGFVGFHLDSATSTVARRLSISFIEILQDLHTHTLLLVLSTRVH